MLDSSNDNRINPINAYIGSRIREARQRLGLSQGYIGHYMGVKFQQVQKMEKGTNRVSAVQLMILTRVLGVPFSYFFQDMPAEYLQRLSNSYPDLPPLPEDIMSKGETLELLNSYYAMSENDRQSFLNMLKTFANAKTKFSTTASKLKPNFLLH